MQIKLPKKYENQRKLEFYYFFVNSKIIVLETGNFYMKFNTVI